ncbi:MAG: flagellar assembly protein FliW [Desulfamplus sp.]|nr:flagellar assembly protein FliW [Desulfamplus sp.]
MNISGEGNDKKITANLMGPIVVNQRTKEAVQFVFSNSSYSHQHDVLKSLEQLVVSSDKNDNK